MNEYASKMITLRKQYDALVQLDTLNLSDLETCLGTLRLNYSRVHATEKPLTTIPAIFGKVNDENFISDYLAHILHPIRSGAGLAPLKALLSLQNTPISIDSIEIPKLEILRESMLSDEDRIDILILHKKAKLLIALENKILSKEGSNQTGRYSRSLQELYPDYTQLHFYLSPAGTIPSSSEFRPLSYAKLASALKRVDLSDIPERDRYIYEDFILHVENYIMKTVNLKLSEKSVLYLKNVEMIADLQEAFSEDSSNIFQAIQEIIMSSFEGISRGWESSFSENREYQQVWKDHWYDKIWVHFEYQFDKESLFTKPEFVLMIDVERGDREVFLERFDVIQKELKAKYAKNGIQYRPKFRKIAIAYKSYELQLSADNLERDSLVTTFQRTVDDFAFLIEPIERVLRDLKAR